MLRQSISLWSAIGANFVSMRRAPSFRHPPAEEVIGKNVKDIPKDCVTAYVSPEVITAEEEQVLLKFVNPWFDRLEYNDGHADGLIHHYIEFYRSYDSLMKHFRGQITNITEPSTLHETAQHYCSGNRTRSNLVPEDMQVVARALERVKKLAQGYLPQIPIDDRVHFLRLKGSGFIRAHVDESRNSSGIVVGLSLNAGRVMTLTHPMYPDELVELLLAPRSVYALLGRARYDWRHSIDWTQDDEEHIKRIQKSLVVEGTPIYFDGRDTGLVRDARTVIIFRGVSPMHLFATRTHMAPF